MSDWQELPLGDVLTLQRGFDLPARDRVPGPFPIVSSSGVTGAHAEYKAEPPGVVIGRYGSLGSVHWVTEPYWPLNTSLWVKDFKGNVPLYLRYLMETVGVDGSTASAVPGVNRNHLHRVIVRLPPVALQRRIASLLSAFDDLIAVNERRIGRLEDLSRSLYREWFVRLRFPTTGAKRSVTSEKGEVPLSWTHRRLFDIADVGFGFSFKSSGFQESGSYPVVRIRDVLSGSTLTFTDEQPETRYSVDDGDVLIGMDGEFHMRQWTDGRAWLNQRVARIRPHAGISARHLMEALNGPIRELNASIVGTTVAHLGKRHLEAISIAMPPDALLPEATGAFDSISTHQLVVTKHNRLLAATRDLLLSRLVTGRLDISEIDLGDLLSVESA